MRPDVGWITPVNTLISVDFPAPLSPISPTVSFLPTEKSISRSAWIAPKNFCTPSRRTMCRKSVSAGRSSKLASVTRVSFLRRTVHKVDHVLLVPEMRIPLLLAYRVSGGLTITSLTRTKLGEHSTAGRRAADVMTFLNSGTP